MDTANLALFIAYDLGYAPSTVYTYASAIGCSYKLLGLYEIRSSHR